MPENQGVLARLVEWQKGQLASRQTSIKTPDYRRVIVMEMAGRPNEVAVIERYDTATSQAFIDFRVEEGPFKRVVSTIRQRNALLRKRGGLF